MGGHFFLWGIFPTQASNPGLTYLRQILYHLSNDYRLLFDTNLYFQPRRCSPGIETYRPYGPSPGHLCWGFPQEPHLKLVGFLLKLAALLVGPASEESPSPSQVTQWKLGVLSPESVPFLTHQLNQTPSPVNTTGHIAQIPLFFSVLRSLASSDPLPPVGVLASVFHTLGALSALKPELYPWNADQGAVTWASGGVPGASWGLWDSSQAQEPRSGAQPGDWGWHLAPRD